MSQVVALNAAVQFALSQLRTFEFNQAGVHVLLFQAAHTVTPATVLADLVECTFPGYSRWGFAGTEFGTPNKLLDGLYQCASVQHSWTNTGANQSIYGWLMVDSVGVPIYGETFDAPFVITSTSGPFALSIFIDEWSRSILPP